MPIVTTVLSCFFATFVKICRKLLHFPGFALFLPRYMVLIPRKIRLDRQNTSCIKRLRGKRQRLWKMIQMFVSFVLFIIMYLLDVVNKIIYIK